MGKPNQRIPVLVLMTESSFFKIRLYFVAVVAIAIESLLTWNYLHGGIPRHHFLADENLPEISNAWGGLLLPILAWFLTWRIQKRIFHTRKNEDDIKIHSVVYALGLSTLYGAIMAVFFSFGYPDATGNMMFAIFAIALFLPVYRAEYFLGFVLGMTVTFGAVLPTLMGIIICSICAVLYFGVRGGVLHLLRKLRRADSPVV